MRNIVYAVVFLYSASIAAQQPPVEAPGPQKPAAITKVSATSYRIGEITVDTAARSVKVPGTINDVAVLEFVANTLGGLKAYESAITLNTNAVSFNAALILVGLDPARGKAPSVQFDKRAPEGDPVELTVEWTDDRSARTVPIEDLLYDQRSNRSISKGPWVYTGSTFFPMPDGTHHFLAETDGVLIGFMHGPQALIDNPRDDARDGFGSIILNPNLKLKGGTPVTVTVKALPLKKDARRY